MSKKLKLGPKQKRWIKALKSGKFTKGREQLVIEDTGKNETRYCCLGVACKILDLEESSDSWLEDSYEELGLHTGEGEFFVDNKRTSYKFKRGTVQYSSLIEMNDGTSSSKGLTHSKIAEFIENNPELVFEKSV